jgi:hypothetical protein
MMDRDEEIQGALEQGAAHAAGDADEAAYRVVFAALREDPGFALPADFADAMAARLMPAPVRASPFETYVLPFLLLAAGVMGVPTVVAVLGESLRAVGRPLVGNPGAHAVAAAAAVLLLVAVADRLARRAGLTPM